MANVLNGLGDGIEEKEFGDKGVVVGDHGDWVDDRDGVEEGLDDDVPN